MIPEEILDIVDDNDQVVGQAPRSEVDNNHYGHFRAVNAFIENDKGQLWIPRRAPTKSRFPLCLDASAAGVVSAGETYEQAFAREVIEETYIDVTTVKYQELGYLTPPKHNTSAFLKVYKIYQNEAPRLNPADFCEYYWLTPHELLDAIEAGEKTKSDLPKVVRILFLHKSH